MNSPIVVAGALSISFHSPQLLRKYLEGEWIGAGTSAPLSRNKREGWYAGKIGVFKRGHARIRSKAWRLKGRHKTG